MTAVDYAPRSERLTGNHPKRVWIEQADGRVAVCCGRCRRRFIRRTVRLAEGLRDMHRRTCVPTAVAKPRWTDEEDAVVRAHGNVAAALLLGRTEGSVEKRRTKLGAALDATSARRPWTDADDAVVLRTSNVDAAKQLGRTCGAIKNRRRRLAKAAA